MFKKISCLMVAALSIVIMSVSAFAVAPPLTSSTIDIPNTNKSADKLKEYGAYKFINAINSNNFDGFLTVVNYNIDGNKFDSLRCFNVGTVGLKSFEFNTIGRWEKFLLSLDSSVEGYPFNFFSADYVGSSKSSVVEGQYILSNFSDPVLVNKILSLKGNKNNYNIVNTSVTKLNFNQSFLDGVYVPPTDTKPIEPKPQEPLVKPSSSGFVVYNTDIWNGFHKNIMFDMGNIIPACYLLFGIVFGIPFVLYIIRTVVNITTGGDEDV